MIEVDDLLSDEEDISIEEMWEKQLSQFEKEDLLDDFKYTGIKIEIGGIKKEIINLKNESKIHFDNDLQLTEKQENEKNPDHLIEERVSHFDPNELLATVKKRANKFKARRYSIKMNDKVGKEIKFGDKSYVLMYGMLLGIRVVVGKTSALPEKTVLTSKDFSITNKLAIPRAGSSTTPPHKGYDFKFKDYAPMAFRHLREKFGIDAGDYMVSLTADYILNELITPGKSGSMFYFSYDGRFVLKTTTSGEAKFLQSILPYYYEHVLQNEHTLLTRFFGLHRVKTYKGKKVHFIVMGNVFVPEKKVTEKYDLKGSICGRSTDSTKKKKPGVTLKDLDFGEHIKLGPQKRQNLITQLKKDTDFLSSLKIMDYSLLLGIHYDPAFDRIGYLENQEFMRQLNEDLTTSGKRLKLMTSRIKTRPELDIPTHLEKEANHAPRERDKCMFQADLGGFRGSDENDMPLNEIYYLGIIDILQPYNLKKKLEHRLKSWKYDKYTISSVSPRKYAQRFMDFVEKRVVNPNFGPSKPMSKTTSIRIEDISLDQKLPSIQNNEKNSPEKKLNETNSTEKLIEKNSPSIQNNETNSIQNNETNSTENLNEKKLNEKNLTENLIGKNLITKNPTAKMQKFYTESNLHPKNDNENEKVKPFYSQTSPIKESSSKNIPKKISKEERLERRKREKLQKREQAIQKRELKEREKLKKKEETLKRAESKRQEKEAIKMKTLQRKNEKKSGKK
ncbi:phosphatidylinositol 5-phosphate 4-kinase isoform a [Anaeramoeba ignava]|uniref:Phosphatidylinositol 5-phosphate 4-kinase isoform a n=1 Tax=Anaeramoeba ignava TaxID=1746090 RepID=A0A9Q0RDC4_ANAIG|nr:phosphatidylinositol 5-phosphate 4-kinase isoform a [Anaeramoeba ignava]